MAMSLSEAGQFAGDSRVHGACARETENASRMSLSEFAVGTGLFLFRWRSPPQGGPRRTENDSQIGSGVLIASMGLVPVERADWQAALRRDSTGTSPVEAHRLGMFSGNQSALHGSKSRGRPIPRCREGGSGRDWRV